MRPTQHRLEAYVRHMGCPYRATARRGNTRAQLEARTSASPVFVHDLECRLLPVLDACLLRLSTAVYKGDGEACIVALTTSRQTVFQ
jgi:hypothetical protein